MLFPKINIILGQCPTPMQVWDEAHNSTTCTEIVTSIKNWRIRLLCGYKVVSEVSINWSSIFSGDVLQKYQRFRSNTLINRTINYQ